MEDGGLLHAKLACGHGFWKVPTPCHTPWQIDNESRDFFVSQELPDSMCQILDAALVSLKNPELMNAAEESKIRKESENAAAANAEIAYSKLDDATRPLDSDRSFQTASVKSASLSQDDMSEGSSQSM